MEVYFENTQIQIYHVDQNYSILFSDNSASLGKTT